MAATDSKGISVIRAWLESKGLTPFAFQEESWEYIRQGRSGLVNAPTGCGKTFAVFLGALVRFIDQHPDDYSTRRRSGLRLLWISPLRALAKDIGRAMKEVVDELGMRWEIGTRNGDTPLSERDRQKRNMPEVLIITPESLHLMLARKNYPESLKYLEILAVDEWHELLGSKRGVQVELAVSRIVNVLAGYNENKNIPVNLSVWGISATIGNLTQAREVLLAPLLAFVPRPPVTVRADVAKKIVIESIIPEEIEKYPWAGHLGIRLAKRIIPIIEESRTTVKNGIVMAIASGSLAGDGWE